LTSWEVLALRYATRMGRRGEYFYGNDPHDDPAAMDYFVWLLRLPARAILVDTGFTPSVGAARGRETVVPVPDGLRRLGVELREVEEAIVTHLHYDHAGHVHDLPRARLWLQEAELRFWTGRHAGRGEFPGLVTAEDVVGVVRANLDGRVVQVRGDA